MNTIVILKAPVQDVVMQGATLDIGHVTTLNVRIKKGVKNDVQLLSRQTCRNHLLMSDIKSKCKLLLHNIPRNKVQRPHNMNKNGCLMLTVFNITSPEAVNTA